MNYTIIIPARYDSTRFPGKPLAMLGDAPLLQHVYQRAIRSAASQVIIATDDERIEQVAKDFGADVCMTSSQHQNGTMRLAEVIDTRQIDDSKIIVNLQGDEPFIPVTCLDQVAQLLAEDTRCGVATLGCPLTKPADIRNPNIVKVATDKDGYALYFSRAPIPWGQAAPQSVANNIHVRHIGLYAYTAKFLRQYTQMQVCVLESMESLEQLRILWHGEKIKVAMTEQATGAGIDSPEDLQKAQSTLNLPSSLRAQRKQGEAIQNKSKID